MLSPSLIFLCFSSFFLLLFLLFPPFSSWNCPQINLSLCRVIVSASVRPKTQLSSIMATDDLVNKLMDKVASQAEELSEKADYIHHCEEQLRMSVLSQDKLEELKTKTQQCKALEKRVGELNRDCTKLRQQLDSKHVAEEASSQKTKSHGNTGPFQAKLIASLKHELDAVKAYLKSYQSQLQTAKQNEDALTAKIASMQEVFMAAGKGGGTASKKQDNLAAMCIKLQSEVNSLKAERDISRPSTNELRQTNDDNLGREHNETLSVTTATIAATDHEKESLLERLRVAEEEIRRVRVHDHDVSSRLQDSLNRIQQAEQRVQQVEQERDVLLDFIQGDMQKSANLALQLEAKIVEFGDSQSALQQAETKVNSLQQELKDANSHIKELEIMLGGSVAVRIKNKPDPAGNTPALYTS